MRILFLILHAVHVVERPHKERWRGSVGGETLTLLMLQKMRRRRTQKKTAMTPVPTRITISMLPLSSEPEWAERGYSVCVFWEGDAPCEKRPVWRARLEGGDYEKASSAGGRWAGGCNGEVGPSTATLAEELTQPLALHTLHR